MKGSPVRRFIMGVFAGFAALMIGAGALAYATPRLKPPAPGPEYLSRADHARLTDVAEALKHKRFAAAKAEIARIGDPLARSLGTWMVFMAEDPDVTLDEAGAFLSAHSDWPLTDRIQRHVESRIPSDAPADEVLAFFETRDPVSGDGKIALARALFAKGERQAGEFQLRDAWINHNFTVSEERRILSSYSARLRPEDHAARVDRLLWDRQVTNARRVMSRLDSHERKKATARAALLMRASNGPRLYDNLSRTDQLDPGLLHAAVRYYRRTDEELHAIALSREAPNDPEALRDPEAFWYERHLLMRWALKEGLFTEAYEIAAHHGLPEGGDFAVAEFNAGWIALRFLREPERAEAHFLALASAVGTPISLSRAYYWAGRAADAQGDFDAAQSYYKKAARHYYSYYGQLAAEKLGGDALLQAFGPPGVSTPEDKALFSSRPGVAALRMLADLNLDYEFMVFAYHVDDELERPGEYVELAKLANGEGAPHLTVRAGKAGIQKGAFAPDVAYPLVFVPDEAARFVSPEIILGLSRQESEFNPRAFSRAGARGMMQLIPSTALITARKEGLRYSRSALLDDPVYNITLGSAHLSHLLDRFDGSLVMAFAAYNAGANRVDRWIEEYGDPRAPGVDPIDWVELVPFSETRNYIQRVLENIQVYRGRLNDAPIPGKLAGDLERGGPGRRAGRTDVASHHLAALAAKAAQQPLPPLPDRTAERAQAFKIALAAVEAPAPPAAEESTAPQAAPQAPAAKEKPRTSQAKRGANRTGRNRRTRSSPSGQDATPAEAPPSANSVLTEEPAPEKTDAPAPAETQDEAVDPAPIAMTTNDDAAPPDANENPAPAMAAEQPAALPEENQTNPAPTTTLAPVGTTAPATSPAPASDSQTPDATATADAETGASQATFLEIDDPDDIDMEKVCESYREFLARSAGEDAAAADLNAGMLAELEGGGSICK